MKKKTRRNNETKANFLGCGNGFLHGALKTYPHCFNMVRDSSYSPSIITTVPTLYRTIHAYVSHKLQALTLTWSHSTCIIKVQNNTKGVNYKIVNKNANIHLKKKYNEPLNKTKKEINFEWIIQEKKKIRYIYIP